MSACEAGLEFSTYLLSQGGQSKIDPGRKKRSEARRGRFLCQAGRLGPGGRGSRGRVRMLCAWQRGDDSHCWVK